MSAGPVRCERRSGENVYPLPFAGAPVMGFKVKSSCGAALNCGPLRKMSSMPSCCPNGLNVGELDSGLVDGAGADVSAGVTDGFGVCVDFDGDASTDVDDDVGAGVEVGVAGACGGIDCAEDGDPSSGDRGRGAFSWCRALRGALQV